MSPECRKWRCGRGGDVLEEERDEAEDDDEDGVEVR